MEIKQLILLLPLVLLLTGCGTTKLKTKTETVTVDRPILYCPLPDYESLSRPSNLPIEAINDNTPHGEVAVAYKASVKQLLDYIERLELTLAEYERYNKSYEELLEELQTENSEQ